MAEEFLFLFREVIPLSVDLEETVGSVASRIASKHSTAPIVLVHDNVHLPETDIFRNVVLSKDQPTIVEIAETSDESSPEDIDPSLDRSAIELPQYDPPNLQEMIDSLLEICPDNGLKNREKVELALRTAFFSPDRAAIFLMSGEIPEPRSYIVSEPIWPGEEPPPPVEQPDPRRDLLRRISRQYPVPIAELVQYADACQWDEAVLQSCLDAIFPRSE
jgi:vacuolar-type H+-ATPase subunit F/Vma7